MLDSDISVRVSAKAHQRCHHDAMVKNNSPDPDWREAVRTKHVCAGILGAEVEPGEVGGDAS